MEKIIKDFQKQVLITKKNVLSIDTSPVTSISSSLMNKATSPVSIISTKSSLESPSSIQSPVILSTSTTQSEKISNNKLTNDINNAITSILIPLSIFSDSFVAIFLERNQESTPPQIELDITYKADLDEQVQSTPFKKLKDRKNKSH